MAKYDTPQEAYRAALQTIKCATQENAAELSISNFGLAKLPPEIGQLTSLTRLDLGSNQLATLPPEIGQLTSLTSLVLSSNQLVTLPPEIGQLTSLTRLDLDGTGLTELLLEIAQLTSLTGLYLWNNQLVTLPPEIGQLTSLTHLHLSSNQLMTLPLEIVQLTSLTSLVLSSNQLATLPPEIAQLTSLTHLYLSSNQLATLPPEIAQLTSLMGLYLMNNQLAMLPPEIGGLTALEKLDLRENPALPIPSEILAKIDEPQTILNYYLEVVAAGRPMNEAKLVLVGQGKVGKTSVVNRLIDDTFNPAELKTEGIQITEWALAACDDAVCRLNVWDFGGQEIMHATHQFFLTHRSLYILVLDARLGEDENRLDYWLKIIESFGSKSPVIIIGNQIDQQPLDIDRVGLQNKYPQIQAIIPASCKTGEGMEALRQSIQEALADMDHIRDVLPVDWFAVKEKLEQMKADYINYEKYLEICMENDVTDPQSQETLIGFMHDLGTALNFRDDLPLEETQILNPEWVTSGVYQIINDRDLIQRGGMLDWDHLQNILTEPDYPRDAQRKFIMAMMKKFELCYLVGEGRQEKFLVPGLMPKEEPILGEWDGALVFQYVYDVLPPSLISRFIVRMNERIYKNTYWRSGVVLESGNNLALIWADRAERTIQVSVKGDQVTRRDFVAIIRDQIEIINKTIPNLDVKKRIPITGHSNIFEDYDYLLNLERISEESFVPRGLSERVSVKALLNGYEDEPGRRVRQQREIMEKLSGIEETVQQTKKAVETLPETPNEDVRKETMSTRDLVLFVGVLIVLILLWFGSFAAMNSLGIDLWIILFALIAVTAFAAFMVNILSESGLVAIIQSLKPSGSGDSGNVNDGIDKDRLLKVRRRELDKKPDHREDDPPHAA